MNKILLYGFHISWVWIKEQENIENIFLIFVSVKCNIYIHTYIFQLLIR